MPKRAAWILVLVDPRIRWSPTHRLARVVGTQVAARWEREAHQYRPARLRKRVAAESRN